MFFPRKIASFVTFTNRGYQRTVWLHEGNGLVTIRREVLQGAPVPTQTTKTNTK